MDAIADALVVVTTAGNIKWYNTAFESLLGQSRVNLLGQNFSDVLPLYLRGQPIDLILDWQTEGIQPSTTQMAYEFRQSGTSKWLSISQILLPPQEIESTALFIIRDNIHYLQTQVATETKPERYRNIVENAAIGIFQASLDGKYIAANLALAQMYGYKSPQDLIDNITNIDTQLYTNPQRRALFERLIRDTGSVSGFESQICRQDKTLIWISESTRLVSDECGVPLYYEGFVQEITNQKQTEAELRESEERYALAIRGANDGLWDWNLRTNRVYFSSRWKAMLGYSDNELGNSLDEWYGRVHPEDLVQLKRDLDAHLNGETPCLENEHRLRHHDGTYRWMLARGIALQDGSSHSYRIAGSLTDITQRKRAEAQLLHDAFHDVLTGLANRALFTDRLEHAIQLSRRLNSHLFAVLFLDLDRFKLINDSLGHVVGDQLLIVVSQRLKTCLRAGDTIARLGGDEFVILLEDIQSGTSAIEIAERIQQQFRMPFALQGHEVFASVSIGIILGTPDYQTPDDLLRDVDTAMYKAKASGRGRFEIFDMTMHKRAVELLQLETDMRRALDQEEFQLHYQPIFSIRNNRIIGFEALLRWYHPQRGVISPGDFIQIAEETGLIIPLGWWILKQACQQMQVWQTQFEVSPPLFISVNLSAKQFSQPNLVHYINEILQETGLNASNLKLEITESTIMENVDSAKVMLHELQALGIRLSIDDFGTGYSSLGHLYRFPIDTLKIDRSFVDGVDSDAEKMEIIQTVVTLAWNLGMDVVAEGVETMKQLAQLKALQCESGQGYLFSKPLAVDSATAFLNQHCRPEQNCDVLPEGQMPTY
jgi:diguanylate cyclase (GGDEF)-like protein/PAS domain S-box-containing protein